jgi:hypothetical protein
MADEQTSITIRRSAAGQMKIVIFTAFHAREHLNFSR